MLTPGSLFRQLTVQLSSCFNIQYFMENLKMKKKGKKMAFPVGDLNPGFLNKTDAKQFRYTGSFKKTCRRILVF